MRQEVRKPPLAHQQGQSAVYSNSLISVENIHLKITLYEDAPWLDAARVSVLLPHFQAQDGPGQAPRVLCRGERQCRSCSGRGTGRGQGIAGGSQFSVS